MDNRINKKEHKGKERIKQEKINHKGKEGIGKIEMEWGIKKSEVQRLVREPKEKWEKRTTEEIRSCGDRGKNCGNT